MIEKKIPVDHILFFDTGWDFPEMHEHIHRIEKYIGKSVTKLSSEKSFEFHMLEKEVRPIKEKNKARANESGIIIGKGWPNRVYRWCTGIKVDVITKYIKENIPSPVECIGYSLDEWHRAQKLVGNYNSRTFKFPLIEYKMTGRTAIRYCKEKGFDWGGLYQKRKRVSCFCCPIQSRRELKLVWKEHPYLWQYMLELQKQLNGKDWRTFADHGCLDALTQEFEKEQQKENKRAKFFDL